MEPFPPRALTRTEVREADRRATLALGIPTLCLMENAGRGLADVTDCELDRYACNSVAVVAGRGNNGADGLVAARHLRLRGIPVRILLASPPSSFAAGTDPGTHLGILRALSVPVEDASTPAGLEAARASLGGREMLVDAVLGTGLEGPVRGHLRGILEWLRGCGRPLVAADLPSGLDADTGEELGPVPSCVATATFLALKAGLLRGSGPRLAGRVVVCDIGVPPDAVVGRPPGEPGESPPTE